MSEQHLKPTCPHCGRQDCTGTTVTLPVQCNPFSEQCGTFDHGEHASDREDYLTEECAQAEEDRDRWMKSALQMAEVAKANMFTVDPDAVRWRKRARKWKRQALLNAEKASRSHGRSVHWQGKAADLLRERDEARADARRWAVEAEDGLRESARVVDERDEARALAAGEADHAALHARGRDEARAEVERLHKIFDDAGQGEHNVLALIDHYQAEVDKAEAEVERLKAQLHEEAQQRLAADGDAEVWREQAAEAARQRDSWIGQACALRTRARTMREALLRLCCPLSFDDHQEATRAAGEPIP